MSLTLRPATLADAPTLSSLASAIWWPTYGPFIDRAQIAFMLGRSYAEAALAYAIPRQSWFILEEAGLAIGFMALSTRTNGKQTWVFVNKLYLHPGWHGRSLGRYMLDVANDWACRRGIGLLRLNVNRLNPAYHFYLKTGFTVEAEVDIYYNGWVLTDYVMRRQVTPPNQAGSQS